MGGSWWARFTIMISVFACALYVLMPTLIGNDAKDRLKSQVVELSPSDESAMDLPGIGEALEAKVLPALTDVFGDDWIEESNYYGSASADRLEIRVSEDKELDVINAALESAENDGPLGCTTSVRVEAKSIQTDNNFRTPTGVTCKTIEIITLFL